MAPANRIRNRLKALIVQARSLIRRPVPFRFETADKRAVVVICHPDDETFCSGLICSLIEDEWSVRLVCATRGEGAKSEKTKPEVAAVRTEELMKAAEILGIDRVDFLEMQDSGRHGVNAAATSAAAERLEHVFRETRPSLVITHGRDGEYGHTGHLDTRRICLQAVRNCAVGAAVLGMNAARLFGPMRHLKNNTAPAYYRVDGSRYSETRLAALSQHASQAFVFADWAGDSETFIRDTQIEHYSVDRPAAVRQSH